MEQRSNLTKPKLAGINPYFIELNTGAYLSRKAVNEGTELDLEERDRNGWLASPKQRPTRLRSWKRSYWDWASSLSLFSYSGSEFLLEKTGIELWLMKVWYVLNSPKSLNRLTPSLKIPQRKQAASQSAHSILSQLFSFPFTTGRRGI